MDRHKLNTYKSRAIPFQEAPSHGSVKQLPSILARKKSSIKYLGIKAVRNIQNLYKNCNILFQNMTHNRRAEETLNYSTVLMAIHNYIQI